MDIARFFGIAWLFGLLVSIGSPIVKCSGEVSTHLTAASSAADAGEGKTGAQPADDGNPFAQADPLPDGRFDRFVQWLRVKTGQEQGDYQKFRRIVKWGLISFGIFFVCSFFWVFIL